MLRQTSLTGEGRGAPRWTPIVCVVLGALLVGTVACGRVNATRDFNHGIRYYDDKNYEASARAFERAGRSLRYPEVRYNLALARYKALRAAKGSSSASAPASAPVSAPANARAGLEAVSAALAAEGVGVSMQVRLHYIAGSIHVLAGDSPNARAAFNQALALRADYIPALRALVKLDTPNDSALARFVLAAVEVEEPTLEEKLPL